MTALILRRLLQAIPVLFIVVTLTFLLVRSAPGNPFTTEKKIPKEIMDQLQEEYDLKGPSGISMPNTCGKWATAT